MNCINIQQNNAFMSYVNLTSNRNKALPHKLPTCSRLSTDGSLTGFITTEPIESPAVANSK